MVSNAIYLKKQQNWWYLKLFWKKKLQKEMFYFYQFLLRKDVS